MTGDPLRYSRFDRIDGSVSVKGTVYYVHHFGRRKPIALVVRDEDLVINANTDTVRCAQARSNKLHRPVHRNLDDATPVEFLGR